ncbi:PREDICTED: uncharacterized protein LOC106821177 [Priapulus caudatus]|uniref:Uncharacterized protein LOC106821177 n=1 Tax=Priapulus caudatus TaxID=37621 RepID=A0ABM1FA85_PRICU|nr:PREDICTED: uncharacterized protein LOC106821177 [Priapulus caudatus]
MSYKPEHKPVASGIPFTAQSMTQDDYRAHGVSPYQKQRERAKWERPHGTMELFTTSQASYRDNASAANVTPVRPYSHTTLPNAAGWPDQQEYVRQRPKTVRLQGSVTPSTGQFDALSTTRSDFKQYPTQESRSNRPTAAPYQIIAPFDTTPPHIKLSVPKPPCPAALLDTPKSGYVFQVQLPTGHKLYEQQERQTLRNHTITAHS